MRKVVEQWSGHGKILIGDREVARAYYSINVYQDWVDASSLDGSESVSGTKNASGELNIVSGPADLELASDWTLVLSDGRRCQCVQTSLRLPAGVHTFVVSGAID